MRTHYVASLELDEARLRKDLDHVATIGFSEAYSNYLIGGPWKSWVLWSPGGDRGDGVMTRYAFGERGSFTACGAQLPYLQEIITGVADLDRLNFVRLAAFSDSVIVPHRDLIEMAELPEANRTEHRVHIPLVTHDECYFSDRNVVYRMKEGEVWHFDASQVHAAASFVKEPRLHLIFDLVDIPSAEPLLKVGDATAEPIIPPERIIDRPKLTPADREAIAALSGVLTKDNLNEVFSIVIKKHFRFDGGEEFAWDTMTSLAAACADPDVPARTRELRRYFELERSAEE